MALPGPFHVQFAGRTDVGLVREHNEDNLMALDLSERMQPPLADGTALRLEVGPRGALLVVCDGMGGAAAGEVASQMAIEIVAAHMLERTEGPAPDDGVPARVRFARDLRAAAWEANRLIYEASRTHDEHNGMGTTMTAVGIVGTDLVMAQVGDSRAYVLRGGAITQVTRDQSLVNQLVETGQITEEQAKMFEHSNVILQALGVQDDVEVLLSTVSLRRGDRVIVCTDGLTGVVSDEELAAVLGSSDDMGEVCRILTEMARSAGGPDNITVIAAAFDGEVLVDPAPGDRVAYERWRLDEPNEPAHAAAPSFEGGWSGASRPRIDPARTFFSLALLLALTLGALVVATQLRRGGGVKCEISGPTGSRLRVDGRDSGLRTRTEPLTIRLPPGRHRIGLSGHGAPVIDRTVEVSPGEACRVEFEGQAQ